MLFLFVLKNAGAFCRAKVPKALCHPIAIGSSNEPFAQSNPHQKNSGTSFNQFLFMLSLG